MTTKDTIVLIEDDTDNQGMLKEVMQELGVKKPLLFFNDCEKRMPSFCQQKINLFSFSATSTYQR